MSNKPQYQDLMDVKESVKLVMAEISEWAAAAGATKTPRGRTLFAIHRRLADALEGKQAKRRSKEGN